ncbi:MAG TPA: hypothetical protein VHZ24_20595 [Pirellulales bacterium]|jgi:hypothetical protein|nr:hypothetical protein [Pirellulales bacterium]
MSKSNGKSRGPGRDAEKQQFWRGVIAGFDPQRSTVRRWCADHGVSEPSFYAWRRELRRRDRAATKRASVRMVPVRIAPTPTSFVEPGAAGVVIALGNGLCLRVSLDQLSAVLDVLESRAC